RRKEGDEIEREIARHPHVRSRHIGSAAGTVKRRFADRLFFPGRAPDDLRPILVNGCRQEAARPPKHHTARSKKAVLPDQRLPTTITSTCGTACRRPSSTEWPNSRRYQGLCVRPRTMCVMP